MGADLDLELLARGLLPQCGGEPGKRVQTPAEQGNSHWASEINGEQEALALARTAL